jgi:hypothetical protein
MSKKTLLKQYFTESEEIRALMSNLLGDISDMNVLEPSVGEGAFLENLSGFPRRIDAIDIDKDALDAASKKTNNDLNVIFHHLDFLSLFDGTRNVEKEKYILNNYDAVICNPPYGLKFSIDYRKRLKVKYPELYVRESYGLFFIFSIFLLKNNGRYVFIMPDTFLSSVNHTPLRKFICDNAFPDTLVRFSSSRFETVNYGYGNMCIISGRKGSSGNTMKWYEFFDKKNALDLNHPESFFVKERSDLQRNIVNGWVGLEEDNLDNWLTLGDLADCKTGIYTGDNVRFIGFDPKRTLRKINGHPINWDDVNKETLTDNEKTEGVHSGKKYVPLVRGGHRDIFSEVTSAIDWSRESVSFYKNDKKARLQNSSFYFKKGISVPMVSTKRISASLMSNSVFDQGVVGVFPFNEKHIPFILLYLNSNEASKRLKSITNGSANNSANYMKRLPIPSPSEDDLLRAKDILDRACEKNSLSPHECDQFITDILNINVTTQDNLEDRLVGSLDG